MPQSRLETKPIRFKLVKAASVTSALPELTRTAAKILCHLAEVLWATATCRRFNMSAYCETHWV